MAGKQSPSFYLGFVTLFPELLFLHLQNGGNNSSLQGWWRDIYKLLLVSRGGTGRGRQSTVKIPQTSMIPCYCTHFLLLSSKCI